VVVEGYTDVIACHRAGVPQAVATCGTALRADHFKLLSRFTERVILAFDADTAGSKAAERGIGELVAAPEASLSAHVLTMPPGLDPADFVGQRGDAFRELLDEARPLVRWWLDWKLAQFDLRSPEGKARAARELMPVLRSIPDSLQRTEYARSVVQRLHLDEREYLAMVAGQRSTVTVEASPIAKAPPRSRSPQARVECEALKFALQHPDWTLEASQHWEDDWFTTPATKSSFAALTKAGGAGKPLDMVLEAAANEGERRFLRGLAIEAFAAEENRAYANEVFRRLEEFRLTRVIDQLKGTLQRMNPVERPDEYTRFFEELIALEARRRALREPRSGGDSPPLPRST
jgi:DNA primase